MSHKFQIISSPLLYPEVQQFGKSIKLLDTAINLEWLLNQFKAQVKYNLMTRKREIIIPGMVIHNEDYDNSALMAVHYLATLNYMPTKLLHEHLNDISLKNSYHPIIKCIKEHPWDGVSRLNDFVKTIQTTDQEFSNKIIRIWMRAAIAAAHSLTGFTNHGVLVIQGDQGIGKTAWVKSLDPINCEAVRDGAILDPYYKDCVISLSKFWIVELGELDATYKRTDIARIKSFITMNSDTFRNPYAKSDRNSPRRTVYIATVNNSNYLVDDTGNRRWWTIEAKKINYQHGFDMQQVWAEVYHEWQSGELTYLSTEVQEKVNTINEEHEVIDPLKEKLLGFYDWTSLGRKRVTATDVLEELGYKILTKNDATKIGKLLTIINGKAPKKSNGMRLHEVPIGRNIRN